MPRSRLIAALEESQYRGLSTAAQKRAFGRDDKGRGWGRASVELRHPGPQVRGTWGTRIVLRWKRANTGVSPLRRKSAPSVEMTRVGVG